MTSHRINAPALACIAAAGAFLLFMLTRAPQTHAVHATSQPSGRHLLEQHESNGSAKHDLHTPTRALEYTSDESLTGRRIASVQTMARESSDPSSAYASLGALFLRRYRETGDDEHLRRTEDAVRAALEREPNHGLALALRGQLSMQQHRFREALEVANRMLAIDAADVAARLLRGDAQLELGLYDEAVASYQSASDLRPDLRTYERGAYMRWLHGDVEGSLELLRAAVEAGSPRDPESIAWCYVEVANVHLHYGNREQPRSAIESALRLVPDYLPALRARARLEVAEGQSGAALDTLDAILARVESVADLLFSAELLELEGRGHEALRRRARAERIGREDARSLAAYRARHASQTELALDALRSELRGREDIWTLGALALAEARAGQNDEAKAHLQRALRLGTPDSALRADAALTLTLLGEHDEAQHILNTLPHNGFSAWVIAQLRGSANSE